MKTPIAESALTAARALKSAFRNTATIFSTRYRETIDALHAVDTNLVHNDTRAQTLLKAAMIGTAAVMGVQAGLALREHTDDPEVLSTDLGPEVYRLVAMSPTLSKKMRELQAAGWTIGYGPTDYRAGAVTFHDKKTILINPANKNDPLLVTAILAHETGHATAGPEYTFTPTEPRPGENYWQWRAGNLHKRYQGESNAMLANAQARQEILDNGGRDIGLVDDITKDTYRRYADGELTRQDAVSRIANHLRGNPGAYLDIYGEELEKDWEWFTGTPPPEIDRLDIPGVVPRSGTDSADSNSGDSTDNSDTNGPPK